jgi:hypothetical protein
MTEHTDKQDDKPKDDPEAGGDDIAAVRREAAGYRTKLRETEGERDKLAERLKVAHRTEVKRLAAEHLAAGDDIFRDDAVDLAALLNDEGDVDAGRVGIVAAEVVERQPHWKRRPAPAGGADGNKGVAPPDEDGAPSFGAALKAA